MWENIVVQIGNIIIENENTLEEQILLNEEHNKKLKEIEKLEKQAWKETQPKKKYELVQIINSYINSLGI